jgi:hypothetical protein
MFGAGDFLKRGTKGFLANVWEWPDGRLAVDWEL